MDVVVVSVENCFEELWVVRGVLVDNGSSHSIATKFLGLGRHKPLQWGDRDRDRVLAEKHRKYNEHCFSGAGARVYDSVAVGQDVEGPFQLPFLQGDPSERVGDEASPFRRRSTFCGEAVKKSVRWQDICVEVGNKVVDMVVSEFKKQTAKVPSGLAHNNASRRREHARVCHFIWRDMRDISNLRRVM